MPRLESMKRQLAAAVRQAPSGLAAAHELCTATVGILRVDGAAVSVIHQGASRGTFGSSDETSRRLDEHQFTFGEGPCLDAASRRVPVLVPDLSATHEDRWPAFTAAALDDGVRGVFAIPIIMATACIGALDLFRVEPGPLRSDHLAAALVAADLASGALQDLLVADLGDPSSEDDGRAVSSEIDRVEVYQATGMLIAQLDVDADEALARLRAHAVGRGRTASQVAWEIVEGRLVLERDEHARWRDQS